MLSVNSSRGLLKSKAVERERFRELYWISIAIWLMQPILFFVQNVMILSHYRNGNQAWWPDGSGRQQRDFWTCTSTSVLAWSANSGGILWQTISVVTDDSTVLFWWSSVINTHQVTTPVRVHSKSTKTSDLNWPRAGTSSSCIPSWANKTVALFVTWWVN